MYDRVVAFLHKHHFIRGEWDSTLTCFTSEGEPMSVYEYTAGSDIDKEWTALSIALEQKYGIYPHSMRLEFHVE